MCHLHLLVIDMTVLFFLSPPYSFFADWFWSGSTGDVAGFHTATDMPLQVRNTEHWYQIFSK